MRSSRRDLAARGAKVYGIDRTDFDAGTTGVVPTACDISDTDFYAKVIHDICATAGHVDVLANVAGIDSPVRAVGASLDVYERIMAVNFFGTVAGTLAVLPGMTSRRRGAIVNVASDSVRVPIAGESAYAATKGAIAAFTESVAHEVADRGVTLHVLYPGFVATPMGQRSLERGLKQPPKAARRTVEQVSAATIRALGKPSIEINTVKAAVLPPLARAFFPGLYRRAMRGNSMPT